MPQEKDGLRSVATVTASVPTLEGAGFLVNRALPNVAHRSLDPFLLLDQMGPNDLAPGDASGFPDHPHRGFETVTYMLEGRFEHKDSRGHKGQLGPGDVQWMTAGAGVVHSEMPEETFKREGGRINGLQLWVNLPKRDKMITPRYQEIPSDKIPVVRSEDGQVTIRVIAGEIDGRRAAVETRTPIIYHHYVIQPGAEAMLDVPKDFNAFAYVLEGRARFGDAETEAKARDLVVFANDGSQVVLSAVADEPVPLSVLLIAGAPLREPVVQYGPFVMNTQEEINQAIEDYQAGRMGVIGV